MPEPELTDLDPRYVDAAVARLCELNLFEFVTEAWKVVEPGTVSFRRACVNHLEACAIVGCWCTIFWRTADGCEPGARVFCGARTCATAVRALAADASDSVADSGLPVGRGGEGG